MNEEMNDLESPLTVQRVIQVLIEREALEREIEDLAGRLALHAARGSESRVSRLDNLDLGIIRCEEALEMLRKQRAEILETPRLRHAIEPADPIASQCAHSQLKQAVEKLKGHSLFLLECTRHIQNSVASGQVQLPFVLQQGTHSKGQSSLDLELHFSSRGGKEQSRIPTEQELVLFFEHTAGLGADQSKRLSELFAQVFKRAPRIEIQGRIDGKTVSSHMAGRVATPPQVRVNVWARDAGGGNPPFSVCTMNGCGRLVERHANWEVGHKIAIACGGGSNLENLMMLCTRCNRTSGTSHPLVNPGASSSASSSQSSPSAPTAKKRGKWEM